MANPAVNQESTESADKNRKKSLTRSVDAENRGLKKQMELYSSHSNPYNTRDEEVKRADTYDMLERAQRELRSIDYELSRCVADGLANYEKLEITSSEIVEAYNAFIAQRRALQAKRGKKAPLLEKPEELRVPYMTLEFVETNPVLAYVDAEHRMGQMRVVIRGKI